MTSKHLLSLTDLDSSDLIEILDLADQLKTDRGRPDAPQPLRGRSVAMIFAKSSTRTRISFEVGIHELGGHAVYLAGEEIGLDVLVHGEAERNDMVEYFAEQLQGYVSTSNGWVQSYGSRAVKPPIARNFLCAGAHSLRNKFQPPGGAPRCFARFAVQTRRPLSL